MMADDNGDAVLWAYSERGTARTHTVADSDSDVV